MYKGLSYNNFLKTYPKTYILFLPIYFQIVLNKTALNTFELKKKKYKKLLHKNIVDKRIPH